MDETGWTTIAYLDGAGQLYSVDIPGIRPARETERLQEYFQNNPKGAQQLLENLKRGHPEMQPPILVQAPTQLQLPTQMQSPPQAQTTLRATVSTIVPVQAPVDDRTNHSHLDEKRYNIEVDSSLRVEEVLFIRDNSWDVLLDSPEVTSVLRPFEIPAYITNRGFSVIPLTSLRKRQEWLKAQLARDAASTSSVTRKAKVERPSSLTSLCNLPMPSFMYKHDGQVRSVYPFGAIGDRRPDPVGIPMAALRRVDSAMTTRPREPSMPFPGLGHIGLLPSRRMAVAPSTSSASREIEGVPS